MKLIYDYKCVFAKYDHKTSKTVFVTFKPFGLFLRHYFSCVFPKYVYTTSKPTKLIFLLNKYNSTLVLDLKQYKQYRLTNKISCCYRNKKKNQIILDLDLYLMD